MSKKRGWLLKVLEERRRDNLLTNKSPGHFHSGARALDISVKPLGMKVCESRREKGPNGMPRHLYLYIHHPTSRLIRVQCGTVATFLRRRFFDFRASILIIGLFINRALRRFIDELL
ncbi:MAG: hypothetical protein HOJ87_01495 [Rhodospirillaceae bacterium]|nr:hypothetical protein [Rhodospirillaceae bacterium]